MAKRNAKCPCGSGKKYKLCHGKRERPERSRRNNFTIVVAAIAIVAAALYGVVSTFSSRTGGDGSGRVWSEAHGHWHDAAGGELTGPGPALPAGSAAPPGPPPKPGQVWSPEHNHWH